MSDVIRVNVPAGGCLNVAEECSSTRYMHFMWFCDKDCLTVAAMLCSRDGTKGTAGASCKRNDWDPWDTIKIVGNSAAACEHALHAAIGHRQYVD